MVFWSLIFGWLLVLGNYKEGNFQISNVSPFDFIAFAVSGKVWIPLTGFNTPVGFAPVTLTDRPKQNRSTEGCSKLKRSVDMTS